MEPQIQGSTSSPLDSHLKRKRGRPRKDENLVHGEPVPPMSESEHIKKVKPDAGPSVAGGDGMVGRVVQCVIDGKFDAGYLVKVKVGDTDTHLSGVVFLPGRYVPVAAANDLAPSAKMYQRTDMPIPVPNFQNQHHQFVLSADQLFKQPVEGKKLMFTFQGHGLPNIAVMRDRDIQSTPVVPPSMSNLLTSSNALSSEGTSEQLKHMVSAMETLSASITAKMVQDKAAEDNNVLQESEASGLNGRPVVNSFQLTESKTRGEVRTELNFAAEGSLLQGIVPSEFCTTSGTSIAKAGLDMEPSTSSSAMMLQTQTGLLETEPAHDGFLHSKMAEPGR